MSHVIKKFKLLIIIYITIISGATYLSIYLPVRNVLRDNALENYLLNIQSDDIIINQFKMRCEDITQSLSNNYLLKNYITEYKKGLLSIENLEENVQSAYSEYAKDMHNLISAVRIVDNTIIATLGEVDRSDISPGDNEYLTSIIKINDRNIHFKLTSPIKDGDSIIGYDIVDFDMTDVIDAMNRDEIKFNLVESSNAKGLIYLEPIYSIGNLSLYAEGNKTVHIREIEGCEAFLYYEIANRELFSDINKLKIIILIGCTLAIVIMVILTNLLVVKSAGKILTITEKSKEKYKEYAIKDTLSGAYSRRFFDNWVEDQLEIKENNKDFNYTAVILDVDRFKMINDSFGHLGGDKAIHAVSCVLLATVRAEDYVIRYGGDEFLILFKDCTEEQAISIMERVMDKIKNIDVIKFNISISYGVQKITSPKNIYDAIRTADEKMYEVKKQKNILNNK